MFSRKSVRTIGLVLMLSLSATAASAQQRRDDESGFSASAGIGFIASPGGFLAAFEFPYAFSDAWSLGPTLQVGTDDRLTIVTSTLAVRFFPDFGQRRSSNEFVRGLRPYAHGGLGLAHYDLDLRFRDVDDTDFMFNLGAGIDYPVADRWRVGSKLTFNVIPGGALGDKFFFSWQLVNATFVF